MIPIPAQERPHILFMPVWKDKTCLIGRLIAFPHVEDFVDDDEIHAVTWLEEFGRGRVMRHADGVATEFLQELELAGGGAEVEGGA
jgi:hypothetical protein